MARPINPEDQQQDHIALSTNGEDIAIYVIGGGAMVGRIFITKEELRAMSNYIDQ